MFQDDFAPAAAGSICQCLQKQRQLHKTRQAVVGDTHQRCFLKKAAEASPLDYAFFENVALCYLGQSKYTEAIEWFDKVIKMGSARDAKSIFYKGISLVRMGRKEEGCQWLSRAAGQNYPGAIEEMRANNCQ